MSPATDPLGTATKAAADLARELPLVPEAREEGVFLKRPPLPLPRPDAHDPAGDRLMRTPKPLRDLTERYPLGDEVANDGVLC